MEINGLSVRGLYLYDKDTKYEPGDFVVDGNTLYICSSNSIGNQPSTSPDYFRTYLADKMASEDDFDKYVLGKGTDKLISPYLLAKIFNKYMSGFDEYGIIGNSVEADTSIYIKDFLGNDVEDNPTLTINSYTDPLDKIMVAPDLNNSIFKVSRSVLGYILGGNMEATESNYVILRQYTYRDENKSSSKDYYVRIQELIDEESGIIRYRYSTSSNGFSPSNNWSMSTLNSNSLSNVNEVINYYGSKIIEYEKEKHELKSSFRFKEIPISYESVSYSSTINNTITLDYGQRTSSIPAISTDSTFVVTICTKYLESSVANSSISSNQYIWRTDSITIDLMEFIKMSANVITYGIVGNKLLTVTRNDNSTITFTTSSGSAISGMYYRQTYGMVNTDNTFVEIVNNLSFSKYFVTGEGYGVNKLNLQNVMNFSIGKNVNLPTLFPNGCRLLVKVSTFTSSWDSTNSKWVSDTTLTSDDTKIAEFIIKINSWTNVDASEIMYTSNNKTGMCRIGVKQDRSDITIYPHKTNPYTDKVDIGGPDLSQMTAANQTVTPVYTDTPQSIESISYLS